MKGHLDPSQHAFWLASRAAGVVAVLLLSLSVILGLAVSGKVSNKPGTRSALTVVHEVSSLGALVAIAAHGALLLGDSYIKPGIAGITIPFALGYRSLWTGLGLLGGYMALLLGPSFYLRRRIGAQVWRKLHRFIIVAWALGMAHTLGAGSDASSLWLQVLMLASGVPVVALFIARVLPRIKSQKPKPALASPYRDSEPRGASHSQGCPVTAPMRSKS